MPLVADKLGNTFLAWPPGSPDATSLTVVPFRGGQPAGDGVGFRGPFTGGDPHMALALDAQDRLWIVWTGGGAVHAARSRSHGEHFGATVSALCRDRCIRSPRPGSTAAPAPSTSSLTPARSCSSSRSLPRLSVLISKTTKKVGKKKVVTHWAQALDDGFPVPTASFRIGGRRVSTRTRQGKAKVPVGWGRTSAPGYVGANVKIR